MSETSPSWLQALPWLVVMFLLVERAILTWRQSRLVESIVARDQAPAARPQAPAAPPPAAPASPSSPALPSWLEALQHLPLPSLPDVVPTRPSPAPTPAKPPAISGPFANYPAWFITAAREIGTREEGVNAGPAIERYIAGGHCGQVGDPWCAIFANFCLEQCGVGGTRSASSQSWRTHPDFVQLAGPAPGAIVVFWRGTRASGLGHVGFYVGELGNRIWTLGGNENDMVEIAALPRDAGTFGLVGYFWPRKLPLPAIGAVKVASATPAQITKPLASISGAAIATPATAAQGSAGGGVQTNITATMFGGGEPSAYGGAVDDNIPGCALPYRFRGERPIVRVTNRANGKSVDCRIVDLGPWNIDDPYWIAGARPQAESGFDLGQVTGGVPRKTNGAGIDLTFAAAAAIGIDGKGRVDWHFVGPKVT